MDREAIESAYKPFVAALKEGGFEPDPDGGWDAALVAAHVTRNNDLIAEVAERIAAGEEPSYDNAAAVDEAILRADIGELGGIEGLAAAVVTSSRRLADAHAALDETTAAYELHVVIRDSGEIVRDAPIPIGRFIEGNASFHLDAHLRQLLSLRPDANEEPRSAEPPAEFDEYELVLLWRPDDPEPIEDEAAERLQRQHLGHFANMKEAGHLRVAGPIDQQPDERLRGICLYQVASVDEARRLAEMDPAVQAGRFRIEVMRWYTVKGALRWGED